MYKAQENTVQLFGFRTAFGGGRSSGFALVYDTVEDAKKYEPKYRLARSGLAKKREGSRKQIKEKKNRRWMNKGCYMLHKRDKLSCFDMEIDQTSNLK